MTEQLNNLFMNHWRGGNENSIIRRPQGGWQGGRIGGVKVEKKKNRHGKLQKDLMKGEGGQCIHAGLGGREGEASGSGKPLEKRTDFRKVDHRNHVREASGGLTVQGNRQTRSRNSAPFKVCENGPGP